MRISIKRACIAAVLLGVAIVAWGGSYAIDEFKGNDTASHAESATPKSNASKLDLSSQLLVGRSAEGGAATGALVMRQVVLFAHLMAFAFAIVTILQEDFALLRAAQFDVVHLQRTGKMIIWLLGTLWLTGLMLIAMDVGFDVAVLAQKPKLAAKITVVMLLTLNGFFLHFIAFPALSSAHTTPKWGARLCALLGVFSSVSWVFASFVGVSRLVAPMLSYFDFLLLYGLLLVAGSVVAIALVSPRLESLLTTQRA